ncbi:MAG: HD domain-containing protein [Anaerolineaceae bacterium]|nr:HD domain-containing protein [Anaerolineaceae bacterium]
MTPKFDINSQDLIDIVSDTVQKDSPIYLVGGAIRNLLLGKEIKDLDFVVKGNVRSVLNRVKRKMNAQAFMLDDERQTGRIIYQSPGGEKTLLDFVSMAEQDILKDLLDRDFTINAMMLNIKDLSLLIDPLNGEKDLRNSLLCCCSPDSMELDPLRVLRGIRLSLYYNLEIEPNSFQQMEKVSPRLITVSAERIRDELFKIFQSPDPEKGIRLLDDLGCIQNTLPELEKLKKVQACPPHVHGLWEHTLRVMHYLNEITHGFVYEGKGASKITDVSTKIVDGLAPYSKSFRELISRGYPEGRTRVGLLLFSALYHDAGKPESLSEGDDGRLHFYGHAEKSKERISTRAKALALSNPEVNYLSNVVKNHMRIHDLVMAKDSFTDRAIHRFFRDTGELGLDICLLSLADMLATYEITVSNDQLMNELDVISQLLNAWWRKKDSVVEPPRLLSGDDLQDIFGLNPGPLFREILETLHEAHAVNEIVTREEAINFVRSFLVNRESLN